MLQQLIAFGVLQMDLFMKERPKEVMKFGGEVQQEPDLKIEIEPKPPEVLWCPQRPCGPWKG